MSISAELRVKNTFLLCSDTFGNADIQISHVYSEPKVINPYPCGRPGHNIQLPYDFFNLPGEGGKYGSIGKFFITKNLIIIN